MNDLEKRVINIEAQLANHPAIMLDLDTSWIQDDDTGVKKIIVARHPGLLEWLISHGYCTPDTPVLTHVDDPDQVRGLHVYGVLPLWLAAYAASVTEVSLPDLPAEMRGKELTKEQMDEYGAVPRTFIVAQVRPTVAAGVTNK